VKDQSDVPDATASTGNIGSTLACMIAGLAIGAAVGIFLAPKSGAQTRQWIANKCLDGVDTANTSVRHTRRQVKVVIDQGQEKIGEAVEAARELLGNS
jgi:gas vesicle protein